MANTNNNAIWSLERKQIARGSATYWKAVAACGLPAEDWNTATCEGDQGNGPCGKHTEWDVENGLCAEGHEIEIFE